jgi:hypothetical protein
MKYHIKISKYIDNNFETEQYKMASKKWIIILKLKMPHFKIIFSYPPQSLEN